MGRAISFKLGKLVEDNQGDRKKKSANGGNKREEKLKEEIKELRQTIAKTSNQLKRRKATKKETEKSSQEGKGDH